MSILERITNLMRALGYPNPHANWLDLKPQAAAPPYLSGRSFMDSDGALCTYSSVEGVTTNHGKELYFDAVNKSGAPIANGQPVYVSGSTGRRVKIGLPINTDDTTFVCVGLATQSIANNAEGRVCVAGVVYDVDTSEWEEGDLLYVSSVRGGLTNVPPLGTSYYCAIGIVTYVSATIGEITVQVRRTERYAGTAANRPTTPRVGQPYFDTTVGAPIWANPDVTSGWVDSTGNET